MKRLLPFVALIVILVGGMIAVPVFLNPEKHRKELTEALSKAVGRPVSIGPLSMGYVPPTLHIGALAVMKEEGNPVFQAESVDVPLSWGPLFQLKLVPTEIQLNGWELSIQRKADSSWDLKDWLKGLDQGSKGTSAGIRRVHWTEGRIHWLDRYAATPQELVLGSIAGEWVPHTGSLQSSGTFSGLSSTAKLSIDAKGQFLGTPQWVGDVQMSAPGNLCTIQVENKNGTYDIKGLSKHWPYTNALAFLKFFGRGSANATDSSSPILIENWQFHAQGTQAQFTFENASSGADGAMTEMKGTVSSRSDGLLARIDGAVKQIPAASLWLLAGESVPLTGQVTGVFKNLEVLLSSRTFSTFQGEGYAELRGGAYSLPETSMKRLSRARTLTYIKKKYPEVVNSQQMPVIRLSAHWQAKAGVLFVEDGIYVPSADVKAVWAGTVDLPKKGLDGFLSLKVSEQDAALRNLLPIPYRTQPIYGRLQGSWNEWSMKSVRPGKIPASTQKSLRKALVSK